MPNTGSFEEHARELAALGIPGQVVDYVAAQVYPRGYRGGYVAYVISMLVVMLGVPAAGGFAVFRLAAHVAAARAGAGYVVVENHGWAALVLGFGLLGVAATATQWMLRGRFAEYCAVRGLVQASASGGVAGRITRWMVRRAAARVPSGEPHAFLAEQGRVLARWVVWPGAAVTVLGLALVPVDLGRYDVVDAAGVTHHSVFGASSRPWSTLSHVETGCSVYRDKSGDNASALYELVFADGDSTSLLMNATPRTLEMVSRLDDELRDQNVPVKLRIRTFGPNKGTPVWDDGCVERVAAALGTGASSLAEMLAPTER